MSFSLKSPYQPSGDQPQAINKLTAGVTAGLPHQVLLGVTGSGKTYTLANVIKNTNLPTLVICHNKTLAAQNYQEFRDFFPEAAVSYFVSYYDYYQPEAYIPTTDTYIEKETDINAEIDKLRLSATTNLLTRPDVIVVASVSCIYNLGSPVEYGKNILELTVGQVIDRRDVITRLVELQYQRNQIDASRGHFRVTGDTLDIFPAYHDNLVRLSFEANIIKDITWLDTINYEPIPEDTSSHRPVLVIYPAKHYIADPVSRSAAFSTIHADLDEQLKRFRDRGKLIEAQRIEQKVNYDLESIQEFGFVNGIENYSRYFDGRQPGDPPFTLLDYMQHCAEKFGLPGFLTIIDESHITIPQVRGMFNGDQARKQTLIEYGFRLPSALDNRPLTFMEFSRRTPQIIYTSATPSEHELSLSKTSSTVPGYDGVAELLIRPTGLIDPEIEVRPTTGQVKDLLKEISLRIAKGERVLVTTMTKRMAEDLAEYLKSKAQNGVADLKVHYLHSDVDTLDRSDVLDDLRLGNVDVVVGINLLREGLDLPEVSLVAILDADKEGFLRSHTSLIQTMGRAARHLNGRVILYADRITRSMKLAMDEVERRRKYQIEYNQRHDITPVSIAKPVRGKLLIRATLPDSTPQIEKLKDINPEALTPKDKKDLIKSLKSQMNQAAKDWDFELAAAFRDSLQKLTN